LIGSGGTSSQGEKVLDPILLCVAYKRKRFYIFSKREPVDVESEKALAKRDVLNEKPTKEDIQSYVQTNTTTLAKQVIFYNYNYNYN
jgi:hypothetical protein